LIGEEGLAVPRRGSGPPTRRRGWRGEAEGFERAEEDLRENAEHGQLGPRDPRRDAFPGEEESDVAGSAYGDADHERSTERTGEP
jgi:hypothetical protein